MTKEELLKPRYKVIADYPDRAFEMNMPLEYNVVDSCFDNSKASGVTIEPDNYPAIFKTLEWWEEREEKDMPEYVKVKRASLVPKKDIPFFAKVTDRIHTLPVLTGFKLSDGTDGLYANWANLEPATKEEYESQKQIQ